ncbi:unnamed protein product [Rotaria sp. Silwood2]|nr:unnamed protein product [Rotaria sp. Silwood2]CAF3003512.1 unnamed protein product [Rotaria sp. Silwood2]CAF3311888.1 unnamed protein product [Rotaria sp. Silwood2]CAF4155005.1 unnamed protein product [Rotaria sp. Silwood2]CAF4223609.1 unnamed protein product [Rotaria sp. Silwood2]
MGGNPEVDLAVAEIKASGDIHELIGNLDFQISSYLEDNKKIKRMHKDIVVWNKVPDLDVLKDRTPKLKFINIDQALKGLKDIVQLQTDKIEDSGDKHDDVTYERFAYGKIGNRYLTIIMSIEFAEKPKGIMSFFSKLIATGINVAQSFSEKLRVKFYEWHWDGPDEL